MEKNNAFKTSLLFLGIIFTVIILKTYFLRQQLFQSEDTSAESIERLCTDGVENC